MFEILLLWIPLCILVGWVAGQKGRSGFGYFLLSFFLSPIIGLLVVIAVPSLKAAPVAQQHGPADLVLCPHCNRPGRFGDSRCKACGRSRSELPKAIDTTTKTCPMCAEQIQRAALKCRYCGADQATPAATTSVVAGGMGYCPGCRKLRHSSVAKCVYCSNADAVTPA